MSEHALTRRTFLAGSASAAVAASMPTTRATTDATPEFKSRWDLVPDRVWAGPEFWANPLQDWRVAGGRLECVRPAPARSVHVLTRDIDARAGTLAMSVRLGALGRAQGSAGFLLGVRGPLGDYRNNLVHGTGLAAGLRAGGVLFIGGGPNGKSAPVELDAEAVELRLAAEPAGARYRIELSAHDAKSGRQLGRVEHPEVLPDALVGNLALAANFGAPQGPGAGKAAAKKPAAAPAGRWWFAGWTISGTKVEAHEARAFGPLLFNQYTLHRGILKMTAQMPPLGATDVQTVRLQTRRDDTWRTIAEEAIHPQARTATFRVEAWDDRTATPYRLAYTLKMTDGSAHDHYLEGVVRADPVDGDVLTVADISCNAHFAFPNTACVASVAKLDPDLLAFTGDQYYESTGGFGVDRRSADEAILDVLRKWYQHGWTWRTLLRDRPTVAIPDDHDVYHGNLWGEGGAPALGTGSDAEAKGGYKMMAEFVNVVHRIQTAHHPDSPAHPGKQGITGYFGPFTYGRVSFAILADRQYKSGPDGKVPPTTGGRGDHVIDPSFDPKTADLPGLELLGTPQLEFLHAWADDWRGAEMKAAISQTIFTAMATHHGKPDGFLVADYDTNAWPQAARNAALRALRRAFAFHLAGDQHLPAVVHYGIDDHRDAAVAFAAPAVNNLYPRWFRPPGASRNLGDFRDSFGHPMTVLACANPRMQARRGVLEAETDKSAGFGLVRFDKRARTITVECWPLLADPTQPGTQFPGWPVTVRQLDNAARGTAHLPELTVRGVEKPVVQVLAEPGGEPLYSLRLTGETWRPFTFAPGPHTIRVSDPESGRVKELKSVMAEAGNMRTLAIDL